MGNTKKGLFLGALVGAGLVWLTSTKKGKQVRAQLMDHAERIYRDLETKIVNSEAAQKLTRSKYVKMAKDYIEDYASKKNLPSDIKKMVLEMVLAQWDNVEQGMAKAKKTLKKSAKK